jgi:hypothetical protein
MDDKQERYTLRKRAGDWLKNAGSLRDGFLVTAAIFYFFGYIVWAINAYRNDLGLIPALEFQYFIAGVLPVLIILGLYSVVAAGRRLLKQVRDWIGPDPKGGKLYLCWVMFFLAIGAGASIMAIPTDWFRATFLNVSHRSWLTMISALIIVVSYPFASLLGNALQTDTTTKSISVSKARELVNAFRSLFLFLLSLFLRLLAPVYAVMFFIGFAALAFIYCVELYPKIPQEFGGARPQPACLDVIKAQISNETIEGILPIDANNSNEPVVRSLRVEVLFSGSDVVIVRSQGRVYKITKNAIQAIATCN